MGAGHREMGNIKAQEDAGAKKKKGPRWRRWLLCPVCCPLCCGCCLICTPCLLRKRSKMKAAMKAALKEQAQDPLDKVPNQKV
jgi:hypothetical protein